MINTIELQKDDDILFLEDQELNLILTFDARALAVAQSLTPLDFTVIVTFDEIQDFQTLANISAINF